MEHEYRWSDTRDVGSYRLPGPEHMGRWATAAMLVSILLHVLVFFALDHVRIALGIQQADEIVTAPVNVRQVEVKPYEPELALPPEDAVTPPENSASLLEEVDLLDLLPEDVEIDMAPSVLDPEYALKISDPLAAGELEAEAASVSSKFDLEADLPEFGRMEAELQPAAVGQITVDPGAVQVDDGEMSNFTDELINKGNKGQVDVGKLDGIESLDEMLDLPANLLLSKKTMLPSDLIFEFNKADLRESSKIGLMKLVLLIDKNPNLYCWIEGHTDLIGGEETNLQLSQRRAEAVKNYLVKSTGLNPERIITRGFGETQPLVTTGDAAAQAPNRRVEIKMRKTPPPNAPVKITPKAMPVDEETDTELAPPKAVLVRPAPVPPEESTPPKALVVPQRAEAVPEVPRALPVDP